MTDLKIEVGGVYKTRRGDRAHVAYVDDEGVLHGVVALEFGPVCCSWFPSGSVHPHKPPHVSDLISEWQEPRKGEVWVAAFDDGLSAREGAVAYKTFPTKLEAEGEWFCGEKAFAIKRVTLTEGQGLDGEGSE